MSSVARNHPQRQRHASLACYMCRKRKIRCGRELPCCTICSETSQECSYPAKPLKPGPKIGSTNAVSQKRPLAAKSDAQYLQEQSAGVESQFPAQTTIISEGALLTPQSQASESPSAFNKALSLSFIIHPTYEQSSPDRAAIRDDVGDSDCQYVDTLMTSCDCLGLTLPQLDRLLLRYFEVSATYQLFRPTELQAKLRHIPTSTQRTALLSAMLAFGLKGLDHRDIDDLLQTRVLSEATGAPSIYFRGLALRYMDQAIAELNDEPFSLPLLQSLILNTHCLLVQGVRGRAWRYLGTCIRAAYELNLHLIDAGKHDHGNNVDPELWHTEEEWRRAWWAIWEMDVFASVIRRCPTGIDWTQNNTFLPAEDENWYRGEPQASCLLELNFNNRWKSLAATGNRSPIAWYIVLNSLMKDAQSISSPTSIEKPHVSTPLPGYTIGSEDPSQSRPYQLREDPGDVKRLNTILNGLLCTIMALPQELKYYGQQVDFGVIDTNALLDGGNKQRWSYSSVYSIYLMTQLTKLMILKYYVFRARRAWTSHKNHTTTNESVSDTHSTKQRPPDPIAAQADSQHIAQYFEAADNIVAIIRRSSEDHYKHINPFLASTIWLAGAVQLLHRSQLPKDNPDMDLVTSNFELLYMTYQNVVGYWNMSKVPLRNWDALRTALEDTNDSAGDSRTHFHYVPPCIFRAGITSPRPVSDLQPHVGATSRADGGYAGTTSINHKSLGVADTMHGMESPNTTINSYERTISTQPLYEPHASCLSQDMYSTSIPPMLNAESRMDTRMPSASMPDGGSAQIPQFAAAVSPGFLDTMAMPFNMDRDMELEMAFSNSLNEMFSGSYLS